ncbi:hypothetical protein EMIHUDRAFT_224235 [Emiliania huxleyi CCMP1516]|uniref:Uncharacterized protein n=2 Tax=Emiliania huxleyi TaxID=2903 RepID=A0A0D3KSS0_EMIH1|nr:hypothetical protein EMIHUDRAFT_224235 [Emiliania huxleyi CCMP1516]EOD38805.1 hypothetical protein EMIHUDRAFT_224235 [Emiliania huxleyi CCMP1516]|eukprot:XP_005791234.1 hypothetical protein EMIHUDRAFT_224235 [Emiliania huxleyi CCMP1516]
MLGLERSLGGVALVVFLASAYSQHSAHEHLVGALDRRIALLEKQAGDLRAQEAGEVVLLRGVLERLTIAIETAQAHDETAQAAQTETEDMAQLDLLSSKSFRLLTRPTVRDTNACDS